MGCGASANKYEASEDKDMEPPTSSSSAGGRDSTKERAKKDAKVADKAYQNTMLFCSKVPLFKRLPMDEFPVLATACVRKDFEHGQTVITQGDIGQEFYVIQSGEADVTVSVDGAPPGKVAVLKTGDYFGEMSLVRDDPRNATITATTKLETLMITRARFMELGLNKKLQFANRKAVIGGKQVKNICRGPTEKTPEEAQLIAEALSKNVNLQSMVLLDEQRIKAMTDAFWKEDVEKDRDIIVQGDLSADYFYVVQEGAFDFYVCESLSVEHRGSLGSQHTSAKPKQAANLGGTTGSQEPSERAGSNEVEDNAEEANGEARWVGSVATGGSFGELALLYLVPRAATVRATEQSVVWVIDRYHFKDILMKVSSKKIQEFVTYLDRVEILQPLLAQEKKALAQAMVEMHFAKDEVILQQGEAGNTFYVLYDGDVKVMKDGVEQCCLTASRSRRECKFFGERALLNNEARAATVQVTSDTAKALALDRDSFNMLLGPLEGIIRSHEKKKAEGLERSESSERDGLAKGRGVVRPAHERILKRDLQRIGLLGCGGFGSVELWEHKTTKETFAMKGLSKGFIVKMGMQDSVMNEKSILLMTNSLFIIRLYETYTGSQTLYFLMEAALGGEIYATYNRKGFHGSEPHARFYIAGVVCAFEHMHERHIIYRDLKPENLLLNDGGFLKVTDMGLAKFAIGKTFTTCGTPDYFAPELISTVGHTNALDWWTLGILTFELMSGHAPFEAAYPMQIYSKVMKGITKVVFPPKCQGPVGDLIKGLLKREPSERLPIRLGGAANIRTHPWYADFDWEKFEQNKLDAPYKPEIKSKTDLRNFHARKEDMPRPIEYIDDGSAWDKDFAS